MKKYEHVRIWEKELGGEAFILFADSNERPLGFDSKWDAIVYLQENGFKIQIIEDRTISWFVKEA